MKILVADDSGTMRRIIVNMLNELGHNDVIEADCGEDSLKAIADNPDVGLALLDWNMPLMNGIECLKAIKANPATRGIHVVMVTSDASKSSVMEAIQGGASNYLVKPFVPEKLQAVIDGISKT